MVLPFLSKTLVSPAELLWLMIRKGSYRRISLGLRSLIVDFDDAAGAET